MTSARAPDASSISWSILASHGAPMAFALPARMRSIATSPTRSSCMVPSQAAARTAACLPLMPLMLELQPRRGGTRYRASQPRRRPRGFMRSVSAGGVTFELDDTGSGDPVLLLHGFPTTRLLWRDVVPHLTAAGFRALAPDLVGYGGSRAAPGAPVDMASQAGWLLELLDGLGIDKAFVVAHDVGSAAAQILLARAPERVRALVVTDGVYAGEWAMEAVAPIRDWAPAEAGRLQRLLVRRVRMSGGQARAPEDRVREMLAPYEG